MLNIWGDGGEMHFILGFLSVFQLIGMLLACCLSRIITANQYEMV